MQDIPHSSNRKIRVGILFGGKSAEHEVSLRSAQSILNALDQDAFEPVLIGIDKNGAWHFDTAAKALTGEDLSRLVNTTSDDKAVTLAPGDHGRQLVTAKGFSPQATLDVAFPVLHGPMGEDGSIQGFLELANIPYVGPNVLGSAIGMDKEITKRLLREAGLPVTDFVAVRSADLTTQQVDDIVEKLGLPLFVKPANMGSSVGVRKVSKADDLIAAVSEALRFDVKALIERAIVGDEIECAILGNDQPEASIVGRIIPKDAFYSYEAKYIDEHGAILEIPAKIPPEVAEEARQTALKAFTALACEGMSRVDMFALQDGSIVVNEINTIPGFTKSSMYPKLWEASGLPYTELITRLITLAINRSRRRQKLQTTYKNHP